MARKIVRKSTAGSRMVPLLHPDAGGIDIGAEEIFVAVPADRASDFVRSFGTFIGSESEGQVAQGIGRHRWAVDRGF